MSEQTTSSTIKASPDVEASDTDSTSKRFHVEPNPDSDASSFRDSDTREEELKDCKAGDGGGEVEGKRKELDTPVVMAVPLPTEGMNEEEEEWWDLKMSWSGKIYDIKVASNDM